MNFTDAAPINGVRRTNDGYLVATARSVRTGIQLYAGAEVGKPEMEVVRVYRDAAEVFAQDSLQSFSHAPITIDHPQEAVDATNWSRLAAGEVSTAAKQDGEWVILPLILKDAKAISAIEAGKRELSAGYCCTLDWTPGTTDDGQPYDAQQTGIKINHLALVDKARAGSRARIGDGAATWGASPILPNNGGPMADLRTVMVDGLSVSTTDAGVAAIEKLTRERDDARKDVADGKTKAEAAVAQHVTTLATKDAEITTLKAQLADAAITPAKLRDAAKAYAHTVALAKKLAPALAVGDAMDEPAIRKAVVGAKLGDAAKDWTDAQIETSFATLAAGLSDADKPDPMRDAIAGGLKSTNDADKAVADARAAMLADLTGTAKAA